MQALDRGAALADGALPLASRQEAARVLDAVRASSGSTELFGSFHLGGQEFALPASVLREVVNFPDRITPVPLAPHFLEGMFTLRGHVIPVLNLARIFDPAAARAQVTDKIAIIDHDEVQVGILFHDTGEVLRVKPEQRSLLAYQEGGPSGVVCGTIMLDDGARLLQILDASALLHIENVPQVHALRATARSVQKSHFQLQAERRQCVSFTVGGTGFAFDMSAIREIIRVPEIKASVMADKLCIGRIHFRGTAVGVVDFAALLRFEQASVPGDDAQRILIARVGDTLVGLLVDSVDTIFNIVDGDVMPIPLLSKARAGMFAGCVTREGRGDIFYLNHAQIFSQAELLDIGAGHSNLYQREADAEASARQARLAKSKREVYIAFALDTPWAVEIKRLREIIHYSGGMLKPPGLPAFVHGVLNLRHQMISVIDLRCLYDLPPMGDLTDAKILILESGEDRFGLIVDRVDNLIHIAGNERRGSPRMGNGNYEHAHEVIDYTGDDGVSTTLNVFDPDAFIALVGDKL
jgi:purine-binding chemotaxis protein CheW